jgi:hypothetical protein
MPKILYVRGFDDKLHEEINNISKDEGITPASILEEAFEKWKKQREHDIPKNHYLLFYSDDKSLLNFLEIVDRSSKKDWFQSYNGLESHQGVKFLQKNGWANMTQKHTGKKIQSYLEGIYKTYSSKSENRLAYFIGFPEPESLKELNKFERIYNKKRINGLTLCSFNFSELDSFSFVDIIDLINEHDRIFILQKNNFYELNLSRQNISKVLL